MVFSFSFFIFSLPLFPPSPSVADDDLIDDGFSKHKMRKFFGENGLLLLLVVGGAGDFLRSF